MEEEADSPAREPGLAELEVEVTWPKRKEPRALGAAELVVREDGTPRRIVDVSPIGGSVPWRFVLYVDRAMVGTPTLRAAAGALAAQALNLAALGTIEVVLAEPEPLSVLPPTREAPLLDEVLSTLALTGEGLDGPRPLRARFVERLRSSPGEDAGTIAAEALADEVGLVRRQTDRLLGWLAANPAQGPSAVLLVTDGFDMDPAAFYRREAPAARLPAEALEGDALGLAKASAALGWTVLPLPMGDAPLPNVRNWKLNPKPQGGTIAMPLPRLRRRPEEAKEPEAPPPPPLMMPGEPLRLLAEATGGALLDLPGSLPPALARLGARLRVRYESARAADGTAHAVEAAAVDSTLGVRTRRWDGAGVPAAVAAVRARRLLDGEGEGGELQVAATVHSLSPPAGAAEGTTAAGTSAEGAVPGGTAAGSASLAASPGPRAVRIELRLEPGEARPLRWTLAAPVAADTGISQGMLAPAPPGSEPAGSGAAPGSSLWIAEVPLPPSAEQAAVVVDDPAGGPWGGALVAAGIEEAGEQAALPEMAVVPGAGRSEPAAILGGLGVRIVRPLPGRASGPVEVEATVELPRDGRLDRVEFFWNDELAATRRQGPFRARVPVPSGRRGFLRVVARLEDGTVAEDAVPLNAGDLGERIDVRLAQLLVVVTDRTGHPVRGLGKDDFRLRRGGAPQAVAGLDEAGQMPITVGLAIDSSASMFLKLPRVQDAARELLGAGLARRDSALLVDYDTEPRLIRPPTRDLAAVSRDLDVLRADGGSNLMRAVVFSLAQLAPLPGRKALVLYSDGVDEGEDVPYHQAVRAARQAGVPLYLILTNAAAGRAERKGILDFALRSYTERLERLAGSTGGKLYPVGPRADVRAVYREILEELRSQYVVSFYPEPGAPGGDVQVEIARPGLTARTLRVPGSGTGR